MTNPTVTGITIKGFNYCRFQQSQRVIYIGSDTLVIFCETNARKEFESESLTTCISRSRTSFVKLYVIWLQVSNPFLSHDEIPEQEI